MQKSKPPYLLNVTLLFLFLLFLAAGTFFLEFPAPVIKNDREGFITILWAKWRPADYLQKLAEEFQAETGIEVRIVQESWTNWQDVFFTEMSRKGERYDMVIGDSQWLGRGVEGGHYIELTKWIKELGIAKSMIPAAISGYSEFPKESGHYWAVPVEGDAMGFSYRKDLFEDPQEKKRFQQHYGYALAIPDTWHQLRDIAEFFYRPQQDLYGVFCWVEPHYDGITMGLQSLLWAWGASLGDQKTYKVKGFLNSKAGVAALAFYKELNRYNNPLWVNNYLDKNLSSNMPMIEGKVAMAMGYFAISPELLEEDNNVYADKIGFFAVPEGPAGRVSSLGGQGISIVSYSKKKELSLRFLKWFVQESIQKKWAILGGLSCNTRVLNSEDFLSASPINRPFKESIGMVRDFWAVPEYPQLLEVSQKYWSEYINQNMRTAKDTMDIIARKWESIFEYGGYYKE